VFAPTRSAGNFLAFDRSGRLPAIFHLPTRDRFVPATPWTRRHSAFAAWLSKPTGHRRVAPSAAGESGALIALAAATVVRGIDISPDAPECIGQVGAAAAEFRRRPESDAPARFRATLADSNECIEYNAFT